MTAIATPARHAAMSGSRLEPMYGSARFRSSPNSMKGRTTAETMIAARRTSCRSQLNAPSPRSVSPTTTTSGMMTSVRSTSVTFAAYRRSTGYAANSTG